MPAQSEKVAAVQRYSQYDQVVELALAGFQPTEISRALGCGVTTVKEILDAAIYVFRESYMDKLETFHDINIIRLEKALQTSSRYAMGYTDENGTFIPPDRNWMRMYVDIVKIQLEMDKDRRKHMKEVESNDPAIQFNNITQTIVTTSDIYKDIFDRMKAEYASNYLDWTASDLAVVGDAPVDERVKLLEAAIKNLQVDDDNPGTDNPGT